MTKKIEIVDELKIGLDSQPNTSSRIRYLDSLNYTRSDIVKIMSEYNGKEIRYQHVRNVLITPLTSKK